ncbi:unnamed protein product, partial [Discosporangium mesarthrocarpum]
MRALRGVVGAEVVLALLRVLPGGQATPYPLASALHAGQGEIVAGVVMALRLVPPSSLHSLVPLVLGCVRGLPCPRQRLATVVDVFFSLVVARRLRPRFSAPSRL